MKMQNLTYEEQAIINMYQFKTKEDLIEKLDISLEEMDEQEMKDIVEKLKSKIEKCSLDELKTAENFFE